MLNCKDCNLEVAQNYCPNCGRPAKVKRIDGHYIVHEIEHVLHFEKGILYTVRELLVRPGANVRSFISDNRSRLVKPIIFIIISSLLYSLISHFFHVEEGAVRPELSKSAVGAIFKWVQDHYGYANIIMGVFIALWLQLFFRKYRYNLFEVLILLCFVMGMGMLIYALFATIQGISHVPMMTAASIAGILYAGWAIGQFFDQKKPMSYVKALLSYILGMISFWLACFLAGSLIDLLVKH